MENLKGIYVGSASGVKEILDIYKGTADGVEHTYNKDYIIQKGVLQNGCTIEVSESSYCSVFSGAEKDGYYEFSIEASSTANVAAGTFAFSNPYTGTPKELIIECAFGALTPVSTKVNVFGKCVDIGENETLVRISSEGNTEAEFTIDFTDAYRSIGIIKTASWRISNMYVLY